MSITNDQSHSVKHRVEQPHLIFKSTQGVTVALYLETVESTVDERKIDPGSAVSYSKFLQKHRAGLFQTTLENGAMQGESDLFVVHTSTRLSLYRKQRQSWQGHP